MMMLCRLSCCQKLHPVPKEHIHCPAYSCARPTFFKSKSNSIMSMDDFCFRLDTIITSWASCCANQHAQAVCSLKKVGSWLEIVADTVHMLCSRGTLCLVHSTKTRVRLCNGLQLQVSGSQCPSRDSVL